MSIGLRIVQGLLTTGEIYLCYCFIEILAAQEYIREKRKYIVLCSILLGAFTAYNRELATVVSWGMLIVQSVEIWISLIKVKKSLFVFSTALSYNVCVAILQMCFTFAMSAIFSKASEWEIYYEVSIYRIICYAMTMAVMLAIYSGVYFMCEKYRADLEIYKWAFCFYGIIGVACVIIFQIQFTAYGRIYGRHNLLIMFIMFVILVTTVLVLIQSVRKAGIQVKLQISEMENQMYEENYREIKAMYDNFAYTYHDIKNHLIVIENYCQRGESEKAFEYIEKIKLPLFRVKQYIQSNNEVMDIILNFKLSEAEKNGVEIGTEVDSLADIHIEEHDLCSIMSNLLDNAIEGCSSADNEKKQIRILVKLFGDMLYICVMNTYDNIVEKHSETEQNIHGYGLKSVRSKVEKYRGDVECSQKNNWFVVTISILQ